MNKQIGVYSLTLTPSGLFYIGSTTDFVSRRHNHRSTLRNGKFYSSLFQAAYNRGETLTWTFVPSQDEAAAVLAEQQLLKQHWGNPKLCNLTQGQRGNPRGTKQSAAWANNRLKNIRKAVVVDGVQFQSVTEAAAFHRVTTLTVKNRIRSKNPKFSGW